MKINNSSSSKYLLVPISALFLILIFITITYVLNSKGNYDLRSHANDANAKKNTRGLKYPRMLADINGDKKFDLIGFGADGVYVAISNGTKFNTITRWTTDLDPSKGWTTEYPRTVGDVNGDGKYDVVGFGKDAIYVGLSDGSKFLPVTQWSKDLGPDHKWTPKYPRSLSDVNGDGKFDAVGFGIDAIYVAVSDGSKFTPVSQWTTTDLGPSRDWSPEYPRSVADVSGDGKSDAVGFGMDAVYVALSSGSSFRPVNTWTADFGPANGWGAKWK